MSDRQRRYLRFFGKNSDADVDDELAFHLEMRIRDYEARGLPRTDAERAARDRLGNLQEIEAELKSHDRHIERRIDRRDRMNHLATDLRVAMRGFRRTPTFALTVVLLLALGIGATAAAVTLVQRVLLQPLPVPHPERLFLVKHSMPDGGQSGGFSLPLDDALRRQPRSLSLAAYDFTRLNVRIGQEPELTDGRLVSGSMFALLGVQPMLGRTISDGDDTRARGSVAVLSYGYWVRRFAADPSVIGRTIAMNAMPFTVIGVMPESFGGIAAGRVPESIWVPMAMHPLVGLKDHDEVGLIARLPAGVTRDAAQAELTAAYAGLLEQGIGTQTGEGSTRLHETARIDLVPAAQGAGALAGELGGPLRLVLAIAVLLLLVICANVAGLFVVRAIARAREIAIRLALGVSRGRLIQQLLVESLVLSGVGGGLGVIGAWFGMHALIRLIAPAPGSLVVDMAPDALTLAVVAAASVLTALLFGMLPAALALRVDFISTLRASGKSSGGGIGVSRFTRSLVVLQLALSLVLVLDTTLLAGAIGRLSAADPGFEREHVLLFRTYPVALGYSGSRELSLYQNLSARLVALPGVSGASVVRRPLGLSSAAPCAPSAPSGAPLHVASLAIGPHLLQTMGVPLRLGREFEWTDDRSHPPVVIVSEAVARSAFGTESAIGSRLRYAGGPAAGAEVVGVARDVRSYDLESGNVAVVRCEIYLPVGQSPESELGQMTFVIRTIGDPTALAPAVRRAVSEVEPNLSLFGLGSASATVHDLYAREASLSTFGLAFSITALVIAAVGLYGTLAYSVAARTREIGIRMALGGTRWSSMRLVVGATARVVIWGIVIGLGGAVVSSRALETLLFGLTTLSAGPITFSIVALAVIALGAACVPARRAARIDPAIALRIE